MILNRAASDSWEARFTQPLIDEYAHVQIITVTKEENKFEGSQSVRRRRCLAEEVLAGADDDVA